MNIFFKHPLVNTLVPLVIFGTISYFTFIKDTENHHVQTNELIKNLQENYKSIYNDVQIIEHQLTSYSALPPRVTQLEVSTKEMQDKMERVLVNQAMQGESLRNIDGNINDIKYLLRDSDIK